MFHTKNERIRKTKNEIKWKTNEKKIGDKSETIEFIGKLQILVVRSFVTFNAILNCVTLLVRVNEKPEEEEKKTTKTFSIFFSFFLFRSIDHAQ